MKKYLGLICLFIVSCAQNPEAYIEHLDGYWEIQEVTLADGSQKQYQFNETIDYISVNDSLKGFRKKMKPGLNDTYYMSDDTEALIVKLENDSLNLYYSTPYANWKETVLEASATQLKISNANRVIYTYKRYTPVNLTVE